MSDRLIRLPEVISLISLSPSTIRRLSAAGNFPAAVKLSPNAVAWSKNAVDDWVLARLSAQSAPVALTREGDTLGQRGL